MFLNLFLTHSQVYSYGTRTASTYRSHHCRINLKQFTILYQGPILCQYLSLVQQAFPPLSKRWLNFNEMMLNSVAHKRRHGNLTAGVTQTNKPFHALLFWDRRMEQRRSWAPQRDIQRLISQVDSRSKQLKPQVALNFCSTQGNFFKTTTVAYENDRLSHSNELTLCANIYKANKPSI